MKRIIYLITFLVTISAPLAANEVVVTAGADYQISIPKDWVVIPRDVLDQYEIAVQNATGQNQTYEYGYQSSSAVNWFEHPYALVQVKRNGRVPEGQLKQYKKIEGGFKKGIEKLESTAGGLMSNSTMGETLYEKKRQILWSTLSMDVSNVGRVKGIIAIKLAEFGIVQFMGYGKEDDFASYEPVYRDMAHSLTLNPNDTYKPRITDNAPTIFGVNLGQTAIAAIIGGLIGGVFSLFRVFSKRKS